MNYSPNNLKDVRELTLDNIESTTINISKIHGFGLFANAEIRKESILCNLGGQVIDKSTYKKIEDKLKPAINGLESYLFMECNYINEEEILARTFRTKYSYINHSSSPNVELRYFPLRVVATRDISNGEELTIDYRCEPLSAEYLSRPEKKFLSEK